MKGIEQAKWPPSPGDKVEHPENSRDFSKKKHLSETVKVPQDYLKHNT